MSIPTRSQCLRLLNQTGMPPHIQEHSILVAEIALYLGRLLNQNSIRLNIELLEAGALLHDIAKARSLATGENHAELGARMVHDLGYGRLAPIVQEHVHLDSTRADGPVTESLLVNYSDKRVKHDRIVTLEERFLDLIDRYAKTEEHRARMRERLDLYFILERNIFYHLAIGPTQMELMSLCVQCRI